MQRALFPGLFLSSILVATLALAAMGGGPMKTPVPKDRDLLLRENMVQISEQLGVTCTHCHDPNNLKSQKLKTWKVAKDHIRVTELLNSKAGFGGTPKVDCFTCHRGEASPKYKDEGKKTPAPSAGHG